MSRGPGKWQQQILDLIAEGHHVILTDPSMTHAEQNAIRRAAYTLEAAGKVALTVTTPPGESRARLVACPADSALPPARLVMGLDGKKYRTQERSSET